LLKLPSKLKMTKRPRITPGVKAWSVVIAVILLGSTFSVLNVPLVSSAATSVEVMGIEEAVPTTPQSPLWERAKEVTVPLSSQQMQQPGGGTTRAVRVRALEDGLSVAFRVSWDDDTRDDTTGAVPSDSAAIQLPIDPEHVPYQCMGQSTNRVNIWQWKAALEREGATNLGALPLENPGIVNLTSNGICKAVEAPGEEPQATSFHDGRQWHVVFSRALAEGGGGTAPLLAGKNSAIAFAVWNGSRGESRGMKAVSTWNTLLFPAVEESGVGGLVTLGVVIALSIGAVAFTIRRLSS
jgi:DMSO reductase family type II enzyme heme b subunit